MSSTHYLPNTSVEATFLDDPHYAPIYYPSGSSGPRLGSVNAGNSNTFYVLGSGGLNAAFDHIFQRAGQYTNAGPDPYQRIHNDLFNHAVGGTASLASFQPTDPLVFALVIRPTPTDPFQGFLGNDGAVFVDIFKSNLAPHGNADNYAMVYACPPYGPAYATKADFLAACTETAKNIVRAVRAYNAYVATHPSLDSIELIYQCLYSSGIYKRSGTKGDEVAISIYQGLEAALSVDNAGLKEVAFENGSDNHGGHIFQAVKKLSVNWPTQPS